MKLSKEEQKEVSKVNLDYEKVELFCHCEHCLKDKKENKFGVGKSPEESMNYALGLHPFKYPDGTTARVVALFCKRCKRVVWDTRHLTHLY